MDKEPFLHPFIFSAGRWSGEGKIVLNMVDEELLFQTHWSIQHKDFSGKVLCSQDIHIVGLSEEMRNDLTFYDFRAHTFSVDMENPNVGRIVGTGVFDDQMIAWEFRNNEIQFEGYESYALQPDGSYLMKGEYLTSDQLRTQIEARIWQRSQELENSDPRVDHEGEE
ncbi:MAG TPA: hypothetical protein VJK48_06375 [Chlamydiales bacterium]|nr:hypothetical protein [Chlamydiales bacterium]